jgi:hypothetical protein
MPENVALTKDSIQMPYRRFLSDSAAGFVLLLLIAAAYYLPIFEKPGRQIFPVTLGPETKVFCLVLAFLLATPLGFAVNAFSWLLLTQVVSTIEHTCAVSAKRSTHSFYFVQHVARSRHFEVTTAALGMKDDIPIASVGWFFRETLEMPLLSEFASEANIRGLVIFLRDMAFFALLTGSVSLIISQRGTFRVIAYAVPVIVIPLLLLPWRLLATHKLVIALVIAIILAICALYFVAVSPPLVLQAILLFLLAAVFILATGAIGFYHYCGIILQAHLVSSALGIAIDQPQDNADQNALSTAIAILAKAIELKYTRK